MRGFVATVVIPVRDEEALLAGCLDAVAAQDVGPERLEVLVVDGRSADRSAAVAEEAFARAGFGRAAVLDNPARTTSAALDVGLDAATAPVLVRVDARARITPGHVRRCAEILAARPEVGVVGGGQIAQPGIPGARAAGIARALSNRWTTGLSRYRRGTGEGPSDTVWMGAFRTEELRRLGGWDVAVGTNQDYELNERYRASGRLVWFVPELDAGYVARATYRDVARQYFRYGVAKGARLAGGAPLAARHVATLAAPPVAAAVGVACGRRFGWVPTVAAAAGIAAALDAAGSRGGPAGVRTRAASVAAMAVSDAAWWLGVWRGALR